MRKYKRREFLKGLGFLGAGALAGSLASKITEAYSIPQVEKIYSPRHPDFPADVIVYRDGDYAVAVDNKGNTIARSTDHAEVIQAAIDYLNSKSRYTSLLLTSMFEIDVPIELYNYQKIFGYGWGTGLKASTNFSGRALITNKGYDNGWEIMHVRIENIELNGNGVTNGIDIQLYASVIKGCYIHNYSDYGIRLPKETGEDNWIIENYITNHENNDAGTGIEHEFGHVHIAFNIIRDTATGIFSVGHNKIIYANSIYGTPVCISVKNARLMYITKNMLNPSPGGLGIVVQPVLIGGYIETYKIVDNLIYGDYYTGIKLQGDSTYRIENVEIIGNSFEAQPSTTRGYHIEAHYSDAVIKHNRFIIYPEASGIIETILNDNSNLIIKDNEGYKTENAGVAILSAGSTSVTVNHGLVSAPSKVLITPLGQPPGKLWVPESSITDTSFDIVTDTAPSADLKIAWYAEV